MKFLKNISMPLVFMCLGLYVGFNIGNVEVRELSNELEILKSDQKFLEQTAGKMMFEFQGLYQYNLKLLQENEILRNRLSCDIVI